MEVPRPRCVPANRGHSLVELMVAASMLAVSMLAALRSQVSSVQLMNEARETEAAVQVLQEAFAQALLESNAELAGDDGDLGPDRPMVMSTLLKDQVVQYSLPGYAQGDPVPSCLTLRFQLAWTSTSGLPRTLTLVGSKR